MKEVFMSRTRFRHVVVVAVGLVLALPALAENIPVSLRGKIFTKADDIRIPAANLVKSLRKQDTKVIKRDESNRWQIHMVAFFKRPLPTEQVGIVVLDRKKEPVAVALVPGSKGQKSLSTQITVDSTEKPGTPHTIRVYFARRGKPVTLAEKTVVLK
jgi:hypothetical protein